MLVGSKKWTVSKELLILGQWHYCEFRVRKPLFPCEESSFLKQCHFSAHCPGLLTPCLHCTWLPSFHQQIPLDDSNNAPLVPGKPTWCTKMLCNTKWLLPLVLLKSGNSSKISFTLCWHQCTVATVSFFFFFLLIWSKPPVTIHVWGLVPVSGVWNINYVFMIFVNLDFLHLVFVSWSFLLKE